MRPFDRPFGQRQGGERRRHDDRARMVAAAGIVELEGVAGGSVGERRRPRRERERRAPDRRRAGGLARCERKADSATFRRACPRQPAGERVQDVPPRLRDDRPRKRREGRPGREGGDRVGDQRPFFASGHGAYLTGTSLIITSDTAFASRFHFASTAL